MTLEGTELTLQEFFFDSLFEMTHRSSKTSQPGMWVWIFIYKLSNIICDLQPRFSNSIPLILRNLTQQDSNVWFLLNKSGFKMMYQNFFIYVLNFQITELQLSKTVISFILNQFPTLIFFNKETLIFNETWTVIGNNFEVSTQSNHQSKAI